MILLILPDSVNPVESPTIAMDTVLFITDLHTGSHVLELAGVFERAQRYGWRVIEIERDRTTRPLREFVDTWRPAGCIMECGKLTGDAESLGDALPVVYIDPPAATLQRPVLAVANDAAAIAAMAAKELLSLDCASYAFVGWCEKTLWSSARGEAFRQCISAEGHSCAMHEAAWHDTFAIQKRLAVWLKRLPRRTGIFAANDYTAEQVAGACALAGYECPREVAIVGVDNDELLCENTFPSLSSVEPDFKEAGRMAADLLHEAIANPSIEPRRMMFGPRTLFRRQSTRLVDSNDSRIHRAVERIRRDACTGLKAADVIAETGLSRRLAEKRFLAATGRTILGEIREVRFAKACQLLRDPDVPIGLIAEKCGWESDSYLKRFFKSRTGMTPREWRRKQVSS